MALPARLATLWRRCTGPRGRDIAVVAISALVTLGFVVITARVDHRPGLAVLVLASGAIGSAALWWRRRWPLTVTLLGAVLDLLGAGPLVLGFGLLTIAVRRRDRMLVAFTVLAAVCFATPPPFQSTDWNAGSVLSAVIAALVWSLLGAYVGARRDLLESLRDRAARAEQERELRADQARISERARIAREMHDVLAHKVSLIALQAGALEVNPDQGAALVERSAAAIRSTARATLEDLRSVLGVLRDTGAESQLKPQPGLSDLAALVQESRDAGVRVDLLLSVTSLPDPLGRTVYRVVQEGLTNVHKHARGARTSVRVEPTDGVIVVSVTNDRPVAAGSLLPGSGAGLIGLRERVALAGGTLVAGPSSGGGWEITVQLPGDFGPDSAPEALPGLPAALPVVVESPR